MKKLLFDTLIFNIDLLTNKLINEYKICSPIENNEVIPIKHSFFDKLPFFFHFKSYFIILNSKLQFILNSLIPLNSVETAIVATEIPTQENLEIQENLETQDTEDEAVQVKIEDIQIDYNLTSNLASEKMNFYKPSKIASELISLRDKLAIMKSGADESFISIINTFYNELGKVLSTEDIIALEGGKEYIEVEQTVVSVDYVDNPELHNTISSIVRPGYKINNQLLRPMEIVLNRQKGL